MAVAPWSLSQLPTPTQRYHWKLVDVVAPGC